MMKTKTLLTIIAFVAFCDLRSQNINSLKAFISEKPAIDTSVLGKWPQMYATSCNISNDGRFISYGIRNEPIGESSFIVQSIDKNWKKKYSRVQEAFFSGDSKKALVKSYDTLYF